MCEPISATAATTAAYVSMATAVAGTAVGVYGSIQQGNAAKASAEYQAAVDRNNQQVAEWQTKDALDRGKEAERQQRLKVQSALGSQRAAMAANGVDLSSGSPLDILGDTTMYGEMDALTIRSNAEREAYGYRVQSQNFASNAQLSQMRGSSAQTAGMIGAGSTLLTGAGQVANTWAKFGSNGTSYTSGVRGGYGRLVGGV